MLELSFIFIYVAFTSTNITVCVYTHFDLKHTSQLIVDFEASTRTSFR